MQIQVNFDDLYAEVDRAFRDTVLSMDGEFKKAITAPVYQWPNQPSPRDIVDTGRLRGDQKYQYIGHLRAQFTWPTEYSAAVHNGYMSRGGNPMPARPWTDTAIKTLNPCDVMARLLA